VPELTRFLSATKTLIWGGYEMSILGKFVTFVASDAIVRAIDVPIKALDKVNKKMEEKESEKRQKLFECAPGEKVLLINQETFTWRDKFNIYDSEEKVRFSVKGDFLSVKHRVHIYDENGKEVGCVKEKLLSLRPSALVESHPIDFDLEINGTKVAKMRSKWSFGKKKYLLNNGWNIEGNIVGWKYKITSQEKSIATISYAPLYWGDTYVVTFPENENELLILMIVLAIDIANAPKKIEDLKDTIHHKTHYWL